jgi:two-component system OmpR family response regulator
VEIRPKIVIVDDDASVRDTLQSLLFENGFDPIPMSSIREFLALGETPQVNLVLIDLKLRGESGLTLASHINTKHNIPIIMLTGTGDEVDKILGLESGADDYIMKPFNPRELIARIKAVLRRYGGVNFFPKQPNVEQDETIFFGK